MSYQLLTSKLPARRPALNRIVVFAAVAFVFILVLVSAFSEPVQDKLAEGTSSVSNLFSHSPKRNASDGALQSYGRKDTFMENLRPDVNYLMSGFHSGWTNDVMMGANLIHLALLTKRVPIVFPFPPSRHLRYIDDEAHIPPSLQFDTVFDINRLSNTIGIPIVQMTELKTRIKGKTLVGEEPDVLEPKKEEIGGWSVWMVTNAFFYPDVGREAEVSDGRRCYQLDTYNIHASHTPVPSTFKPARWEYATAFSGLVDLFQPRPNAFMDYYLSEGVPAYFSSRERPVPTLAPDDHVLYVDFLYNLGEGGEDGRVDWTGKGERGKVGAWESVGKHMRWNPELEEMAKGYLRRAFGVRDGKGKKVPPFIAVHIRRSDIGNICADLTPEEIAAAKEKNCYVSLSAYVERVSQVQALLAKEKGIHPKHVVATTDEHGEDFLAEVKKLGWIMLDHDKERTIEKNGLWYPTLIDSVVLSLGTGFVGTSGSTMSILARRRVEDWNGGIGKQVSREYGGVIGDD